MEEVWKDIEGYEGLYQVSNKGNVKSLVNNKGVSREKLLKPIIENGYVRVRLCKDKTIKNYSIHRLVAKAFIENPNNFPIINHKDECKTNNSVENLEWCSYKYNLEYNNGQKIRAESRSKKVYQYTKDFELISVWESTSECGRNGYNISAVSTCCRKCFNRPGNNVYKGYIWSYEPIK